MRAVNALLVGLLAVTSAPAADPPKGKLAELVKLYQAYELPAPPKDAKLYRYAVPAVEGKRQPPPPRIGFGLNPDKDGVPTWFLDGCETDQFSPEFTTEIAPDIKHIPADEIHLTTIVQLHLRGWTELAEAALARDARWAKEHSEQALAWPAWHYWLYKLHDPKVDRALIVRRMASAMQLFPDGFRDKESEMLFVDLRWSLMPSRAKPGTVEALIDEWVDIAGDFTPFSHDGRYEAVVRLGFDAVPALIDALTDTRLSRAYYPAFAPLGHGPVRHRIKDLAADILRGFMYDGEPFAEKEEGGGLDVKAVKKWWAKVKKANEEEYMVGRVLRAGKYGPDPNGHLLTVIRHKYPHRLPPLYRHVLTDHPDADIGSLAAAVTRSTLPKETKRELLLAAMASKVMYRQRSALMSLREVDADVFHRELIGVLSGLSLTPTDPQSGRHREDEFAYDVCLTTDAKVWATAEQYVKRADPGIRLRWLRTMYTDKPRENEVARLRLAFMTRFLTDDAVHDPAAKPKLYPHEQHALYPDFKAIEVRNYAAILLSRMLDVKGKPTPKWSADEWAKFRDEVTKAAKAVK